MKIAFLMWYSVAMILFLVALRVPEFKTAVRDTYREEGPWNFFLVFVGMLTIVPAALTWRVITGRF